MGKYRFSPILMDKVENDPLLASVVAQSSIEGDTYVDMLEKALFLQIEAKEDTQRQLNKYVHKYGTGLLQNE